MVPAALDRLASCGQAGLINRTCLTHHALVELFADVSAELSRAPADVETILVVATSRLSHLRPAMWIALVMNPNPETSRMVIAYDQDRDMARYVEHYVAAVAGPHRVPTVGLSKQVIESGTPTIVESLSFDEFLERLAPVGQDYRRRNPPPVGVRLVDLLIVPMRVGGATVGVLAMLDADGGRLVREAESGAIQLVADRIGLSVEHARLAGDSLLDTAEIELVQAILLANRHSRDLRLTTGLLVGGLTAMPNVDAADVMLLTEDGRELIVAASAGYRSPWPPEHRLNASYAALEKQEVHISYRAELDLKVQGPRRSQFIREGFQTFVNVPLHTAINTVGVLNLYGRRVIDWERKRLEFLDALGGLLAIAIDGSSSAAGSAPRPTTRPNFSNLELEVLRLIAGGFTNRQIAARVYRSEHTVKFYVHRLLDRSEVANRAELVRRATREGWV